MLGAVLCHAYMGCCAAVGNGGWDGAIEDLASDILCAICDVTQDIDLFGWLMMILLFDLAGRRGCV